MITISAVLIVKNESNHLDRCLTALHDVVDEIVIADTGSTDNTIEIARRHTPEVIAIPWQDDFSLARNSAIEHASGDWILVVDADEVVQDPVLSRQYLQRFTDKKHFIGTILVQSPTILNGEKSISNSHIKRFFPRLGYKFYGHIHEQVEAEQQPVQTASTGIRVMHSGYLHDIDDINHKSHRNIPLLQKAIDKEPEDEYLHYQLGRGYFTLGDYSSCILPLEKALELIQFSPNKLPLGIHGPVAREMLTNAITSLGYAFVNLGDIPAARSLVNQHKLLNHIGTQWADFSHLCGYLAFLEGDINGAISGYEQSLLYGQAREDVEGTGSYSSAYHLGLLAEVEGDIAAALSFYTSALELNVNYKPALKRCVECATENNLPLSKKLHSLVEYGLASKPETRNQAQPCNEPVHSIHTKTNHQQTVLPATTNTRCNQPTGKPTISVRHGKVAG
ncbi:hypothetical protein AB833_21940 [Chromatiales bacterium (ex Bugula neritina AB1)]|nr:hypothetical protein AB833_21940 [Chromatiales bacterium (ex Bugula neritina AB1)]